MSIATKTLDKAIDTYYAALAELAAHHVTSEAQIRRAFESMLVTVAKEVGWTLIAEEPIANRKRPDAILRDNTTTLPRGLWEAKDIHDDLETEIAKKIALKYSLTNTIFEDSRTAILYQNGKRNRVIDLSDRRALADLLHDFFTHTEPEYESYTQAVAMFRERVPKLAKGLVDKITLERQQKNTKFVTAYVAFKELCQTAIDPRISDEAIDEMLVQHLLTERLFRTVFENQDFTRRNVIAAEIEKVIDALTSRNFNRQEFQSGLEHFYAAIEAAARTVTDYKDKQDFLNTVYERFFQGFAIKQADTHGIVYTPQPIVDFMCASVEDVLQREFGRSLADRGVQILDPCTGTGNFIVNILNRIATTAPQHLAYKYQHDLFANEIMLLPYYIASMNIEHAYYERAGTYQPFEGLCFTDTLALAEGPQMALFAEENTARVEAEKKAEIMVVIGNPPYNVGQVSENDNNKNRKYDYVDGRIKSTYVKSSEATLHTKLYDAYVRFFRWASDRLNGKDGIVCYVSNNSFVDQHAFDGMRKHLLQDFTQIYHLNLHGNVRHNPKLSGTTHNIFGIQVGVGITVAIRKSDSDKRGLWYHRVPEDWRKTEKLAFLGKSQSIPGIKWQELEPDEQHNWITEGMHSEFSIFLPLGSKEAKSSRNDTDTIFKTYCLGVSTNRDSVVYDFDREALARRVEAFIEDYNAEVSRWVRAGKPSEVDMFVHYEKIKWSEHLKGELKKGKFLSFNSSKIRSSLYRPFCKESLYYDTALNDRPAAFNRYFSNAHCEVENAAICLSGLAHRIAFTAILTNNLPNLALNSVDGFQSFPLYTYDEDGSNRRDNITDWALAQFQAAYGPEVTKRDIFHYVYAVLHHPAYRARYQENLKKELPRIPLVGHLPTTDNGTMITDKAGQAMMDAHGEMITPDRGEDRAVAPTKLPDLLCATPTNVGRGNPSVVAPASDVIKVAPAHAQSPSPSADGEGLGWGHPARPARQLPTTTFQALVTAGEQLAHLHLTYETAAPDLDLRAIYTPGVRYDPRVTKMTLSRDKTALTYNDSLRFEGIPPEVFAYRLGNRSALDWIIDQYQVSTDKRSGITTDPNRTDDPEYIINLIKRVITVSRLTVALVNALPTLGLPE